MRKIKIFVKRVIGYINPKEIKIKREFKKEINDYFAQDFNDYPTLKVEKMDWEWLFLRMLNTTTGADLKSLRNLFEGFSKEKLIEIKRGRNIQNSTVTLVCAIKNNLTYLKKLLPYYRDLGVGHFVFIDNNSEDETADYLKDQDDVTLFSAPYSFNGVRKAGWKLQTISYIGLNKWYLWLDSDEFLAYPRMETIKLDEYLKTLYKQGIRNIGGFMLDMYPSHILLDEKESSENFYEEYVYFDKYNNCYQLRNDVLYGGMRGRLLDIYDLRLDKTPIVYCSKDNIPNGNHTTFPKRKNLSENYGCVLKHYKFLSSDIQTIKKRAKDANSGYSSFEAQQKYEKLIGQSAYDSKFSMRYEDSNSIMNFPFVKDLLK